MGEYNSYTLKRIFASLCSHLYACIYIINDAPAREGNIFPAGGSDLAHKIPHTLSSYVSASTRTKLERDASGTFRNGCIGGWRKENGVHGCWTTTQNLGSNKKVNKDGYLRTNTWVTGKFVVFLSAFTYMEWLRTTFILFITHHIPSQFSVDYVCKKKEPPIIK